MSANSIRNFDDLKSYIEQKGSNWDTLTKNPKISSILHKIIKDSNLKHNLTTMTDSYGNTLMHSVVSINFTSLAKELIANQKINWNVQNRTGNTPLHLAAIWNDETMIQRLLTIKTVSQTISNHHGRFPVDEVSTSGRQTTVDLFTHPPLLAQLLPIQQLPYPIIRETKLEEFKTFFKDKDLKVCIWGGQGTGKRQFVINFLIRYLRTFYPKLATFKRIEKLPAEQCEDDQLIIFNPPADYPIIQTQFSEIKHLIAISQSEIRGLPCFELTQLTQQVAEDFVTENTDCDEANAQFISERLLCLPIALDHVVRCHNQGTFSIDQLVENWNDETLEQLINQGTILRALTDCAVSILRKHDKEEPLNAPAEAIIALYKKVHPDLLGRIKEFAWSITKT